MSLVLLAIDPRLHRKRQPGQLCALRVVSAKSETHHNPNQLNVCPDASAQINVLGQLSGMYYIDTSEVQVDHCVNLQHNRTGTYGSTTLPNTMTLGMPALS